MAKILLISANTRTAPYHVWPAGLMMIGGALAAAGHEVRVHDLLFPAEPLPVTLTGFAPDLVGISVRNVDTVNSLADDELNTGALLQNLCADIRRHRQAKIILGGAGFSVMPRELLTASGADCGVTGPGELDIVSIAKKLLADEPVPPLTMSGGFDRHPRPLLDVPLLTQYLRAGGIPGVLTKRGCRYRCVYCSYPRVDGGFFAPLDPRAVVAYVKQLEHHGVTEIFFTDSVFNDAAGHAVALAEELLRQQTRVRWAAYFTPEHLDQDELALFQRAGLRAIELGTDAASDETLRGLGKPFRMARVFEFQETCNRLRIPCAHFVIFGGPRETPLTVTEGLANLARLEHCVVIAASGVRIHAGTALHRLALREGQIAADADLLCPAYYFSRAVNVSAMNEQIKQSFHGRRDRIFPPDQADEITATMRRLGYRGLLWDLAVRF
ncbi:MAG: cobalamin-dependent protein [Verrucomicrobiales bacterium]|jgi:hypothetical protein|nr:cobalamin-dependent protein [Verrucomicrobiales bacterium]